jgi:hypothetical protein
MRGMVILGHTKGGIAVGIGPGIRLAYLAESSLNAALEQLLHQGRLTLPQRPDHSLDGRELTETPASD